MSRYSRVTLDTWLWFRVVLYVYNTNYSMVRFQYCSAEKVYIAMHIQFQIHCEYIKCEWYQKYLHMLQNEVALFILYKR